ncbi:MAG: STAS domain-containing protein [Phycisphaerales bacterium]|nr:STAS domain-containing protein [Phycisphaerales bacterium]
MSFTLSKSPEESLDQVVLSLQGQPTNACQNTNPFPFESFLGKDWASHAVLLDMEQIDYLDSSSVGWLIASQKAFHAAGGTLVLYSLQPRIRQLLTMLRIERVVPLAEDLAAAKAMTPVPAMAAR